MNVTGPSQSVFTVELYPRLSSPSFDSPDYISKDRRPIRSSHVKHANSRNSKALGSFKVGQSVMFRIPGLHISRRRMVKWPRIVGIMCYDQDPASLGLYDYPHVLSILAPFTLDIRLCGARNVHKHSHKPCFEVCTLSNIYIFLIEIDLRITVARISHPNA